jgi:acyl-CoA reductase-like NAD-dependent aldehyde dehydrogenase
VRKITFTGSTAVGKILMAGAAKTVKKVITTKSTGETVKG